MSDQLLEKPEEFIQNPTTDNIQILCKAMFDKWLAPGQAEIVKSIVLGNNRVAILAPTRYGKSVAIGTATALYVVLNPGKNVTIMANKNDTCDNIRSEFIESASNFGPLRQKLGNKSTDTRKLAEELSKSKISLSDGTKVVTQTAGSGVKPDALDGKGGDLNILDESDNVPDENFQKGIRRMMGESENAKLVQTGNATLRNKHFHKAWQDPDYEKVKVDWERAVTETYGPKGDKCLTREFVEKEKADLPPSHFKSMYECEFPDEEQTGLISYKNIRAAEDREFGKDDLVKDPIVLYGLDVAREGRDHSVLTRVEKHGSLYVVTGQESFDIPDIQKIAEKTMSIVDNRDGDNYTRINVDSHGIGSGALDVLRNNNYYATGVKVGVSSRKALNRPDDFANLKAEFYDKVRQIFNSGDIMVDADSPRLGNELNDLETEISSRGKISVVDPNKSPDFADSLMLAISVDKPRKTGSVGRTKVF